MSMGRALTAVIALVGAALLWTGIQRARETATASAEAGGERATLRFFRDPAAVPQFTATDLDGRQVTSSQWKGKVLIVNFWATWCPPCRAEIPDLVALQNKYRDKLQVIGISEDEVSPEEVKRFAAEHNVN